MDKGQQVDLNAQPTSQFLKFNYSVKRTGATTEFKIKEDKTETRKKE